MKPALIISVASLLLLTACEKEIFGRLQVAQSFEIKTRTAKGGLFKRPKFENHVVPTGNWKGSLKFEDSTNVWLLIEDGNSKKISPFVLSQELKQAFKNEVSGKFLLRASESGQTVDVAVEMITNVSNSQQERSIISCSREIVIGHREECITTDGNTSCHFVDITETQYGSQEVFSHFRRVEKDILVTLLDVQSGANLASLAVEDNSAKEIVDYSGPCYFH